MSWQFEWNASHEEVLKGFETLYGAGNVEVSGNRLAAGFGNLSAGSEVVTAVETTEGTFEEGKEISGRGIPSGTTITKVEKVGPETKLTLSQPAAGEGTHVPLAVLAPYVITFVKGAADQTVLLPSVASDELKEPEHAPVNLTQNTEGRPDGEVVVKVENLGDAPADGAANTVAITDALPQGFEAVAISGDISKEGNVFPPLECALSTLKCERPGAVTPYEVMEVRIAVVANRR